jgi:hypothetical protein
MLPKATVFVALLLPVLTAPVAAATHVITPPLAFGVKLTCQLKRQSQTASDVWLYNPATPVHVGTAIQITDNTGKHAVVTAAHDIPPVLSLHNVPLIGETCTAKTTLLTIMAPPAN